MKFHTWIPSRVYFSLLQCKDKITHSFPPNINVYLDSRMFDAMYHHLGDKLQSLRMERWQENMDIN